MLLVYCLHADTDAIQLLHMVLICLARIARSYRSYIHVVVRNDIPIQKIATWRELHKSDITSS